MNVPLMLQTLFDANTAGDISKAGKTVSGKTGAAGGFVAVMGQVRNAGRKDARMISQTPPVILKGHALIAQLKKNLQSSGVPLDQLTADSSAMAAIEKVLVGAGFEAGQIRNLLGELKMNADGNGVRVSALFEGISRLTEPTVAKSQETYLEISSLPHIETLLAKFGLTPDQIKTALSRAKVEGKGVDAARLAYELKLLRQGVGLKKNIVSDEDEAAQIAPMMQQIGLAISVPPSGKFDLAQLVTALEKSSGRDATSVNKGSASVSKAGAPGMTDASRGSQELVNYLKQMKGQSSTPALNNPTSATDALLSSDRFATEHQMAAVTNDSALLDKRPSDDWDLFVKNVKSLSSGKAMVPGRNTGALFLPSHESGVALMPGMDSSASQNGIANSLFSNPLLFQPIFRKDNPAQKGINSQSKAGMTAGIAAAGRPNAVNAGLTDAIKAVGGSETNLEETVAATAAKTGDQGIDALMKQGKAARKSTDFPGPVLGDGIARRSDTVDSKQLSSPQQPAGRMFPHYLLDQVSRQILLSRLTNENEIQIQLKPSSLGRLKMSIENTPEGLRVNIIAENQAARDALLSNSGDLKTALMDQGLRLDKINVETQADFNQTMANTRQGSDGSGGRKRSSGGNRIRVAAAESEGEIMKMPQYQANALNLVA